MGCFARLEGRVLFSTYTVTTAADAGAGSLRQAIVDANKHAGPDAIHFAIGTGPRTIAVASALPTITDPLVLDATTQPGFAGKPLIELTGSERARVGRLAVLNARSAAIALQSAPILAAIVGGEFPPSGGLP